MPFNFLGSEVYESTLLSQGSKLVNRFDWSAIGLLDAKHSIERITCLIDECFGKVLVGMKVLEGQIAVIADIITCLHYSRPVGGSIKQRAKSPPANDWCLSLSEHS